MALQFKNTKFNQDVQQSPGKIIIELPSLDLDSDSEPTPPFGYTSEELEMDNPYNQWMRDISVN